MRTAIYGAGSLGTILGAFISKAGEAIELINRNKAHVEALNSNGAKVTGTVEFTQKVTAYTPDQMSGEYDIIFLMTKQQNNKETRLPMVSTTCPTPRSMASLRRTTPRFTTTTFPRACAICMPQRIMGVGAWNSMATTPSPWLSLPKITPQEVIAAAHF